MKIIKRKEKSRFEAHLNGWFAYVEYSESDDTLVLFNTFIPKDLASIDGFAVEFIQHITNELTNEKLKLDIQCPYLGALMMNRKISLKYPQDS